ncbi:hypothetical protein IAQ61_006106 [Plenodomus lingam]|uniref:uncharacterized protein n=1 Tax=Leptosphaeria maculans TaxID=5022 RepID=UPI0033297D22|nr:hypothetical protein IAQ61_006106 [Plenodomus lingam]
MYNAMRQHQPRIRTSRAKTLYSASGCHPNAGSSHELGSPHANSSGPSPAPSLPSVLVLTSCELEANHDGV